MHRRYLRILFPNYEQIVKTGQLKKNREIGQKQKKNEDNIG